MQCWWITIPDYLQAFLGLIIFCAIIIYTFHRLAVRSLYSSNIFADNRNQEHFIVNCSWPIIFICQLVKFLILLSGKVKLLLKHEKNQTWLILILDLNIQLELKKLITNSSFLKKNEGFVPDQLQLPHHHSLMSLPALVPPVFLSSSFYTLPGPELKLLKN